MIPEVSSSARFAALCWLFLSLLAAVAAGADEAKPKSVLVLYGERGDLPAIREIGDSFRSVFHTASNPRVELFSEYCDFARFPPEEHGAALVAFFRSRYAGKKFDLIIPVWGRALEFALDHREVLFPGVPIVFCTGDQREVQKLELPADVTGVLGRFDIEGTLALIRSLQPEAPELIVVHGTAGFDERWAAETRAIIERDPFWRSRVRWIGNLSLEQTSAELRRLPRSHAVLFLSMLRDSTGRTMTAADAVRDLAAASNAPVYALGAQHLHLGVVGGAIYSFAENGRQTAELAMRVMRGEWIAYDESAAPVPSPLILRWPALRRWGLHDAVFPPGTTIQERPPSLWEEHRNVVIAGGAIVVTQAGLIGGLLWNRARRRRTELELRASEERMSLAAEAAALGLWAWDLRLNEIWATKECRALLALRSGEELTYETFLAKVHGEDRASVDRAVQDALRGERLFEIEYRLNHADDQWIGARGRVAFDENGNPVQMLGVCIDITARREAEHSANRSESRLSSAVEVAALGLYERRDGSTTTFFDARARALLGIPCESDGEALHLLGERIHPEDRVRVETLREHLDTGQITHGSTEYRYTHPRGGMIWISEVARVVPGGKSGAPKLQVGVFQDITARKQQEHEIERQRMELAHASRVSTLGQLASSLAHELNQPLGAILRNAEAAEIFLAEEKPDLEEVRAILADIRKDDHRAGEVIERMRALLKRRALDLQPLSIAEIVREIVTLARTDSIARHAVIEVDIPDDLPRVQADRVHLQQVLLNLIVNGMDALDQPAPDQRRVTVRAREAAADRVRVSVIDTGHGIDPVRMEELFQPFFTTKANGMGIGLSISRTIIEAHHGEIWAENNRDRGAAFHVSLPIAQSARTS